MRPEAFTQLKDQRMKDMGAEIITVDQQYRPGSGAGEGSTGLAQFQLGGLLSSAGLAQGQVRGKGQRSSQSQGQKGVERGRRWWVEGYSAWG